jgi:hypothetical protein
VDDAEQKILDVVQHRKNMLVLCECSMESLSPDFGSSLSFVTYLDISHNALRELPPSIGNMVNLTKLYSNNNQLQKLPPELGSLDKLLCLYLENNQITELPHALLGLGLNKVGRSSFHCNLANNPLRSIPEPLEPANAGNRANRTGNWMSNIRHILAPEVNGQSILGKGLDRWHLPLACPKLLELVAAAFMRSPLSASQQKRAADLLPPDLEWYLQQGSACSAGDCGASMFAPIESQSCYSFRYGHCTSAQDPRHTLLTLPPLPPCTAPRPHSLSTFAGIASRSLRLVSWFLLWRWCASGSASKRWWRGCSDRQK